MADLPAELLAGRYRLLEPIGEGGMGVVWRAVDELLGRDVAVKEIAPNGLTESELGDLRERAIREARAIARIQHPNVVQIFDVVRDQDDAPWIVMELVRSRSLFDLVNADGPLPPARAAGIGLAVLGALRAAHAAEILHRDVKPANVLLGENGRIVLTDFGLAEMAGDSAMTRTGVVLGSPSYLAPERALDEEPGPAADLWSLGATLYAAVEGRPPYEKSSPMATLAALMVEAFPAPQQAGVLLPVLEALLRKDPRERADADEAGRLLQAAAKGEAPEPATAAPATPAAPAPATAEAPVVAAAPEAAAAPAPSSAAPGDESAAVADPQESTAVSEATTAALLPPAPRRDRRRHWAVAAAVLLVAAGIAVWPFVGSEGAERMLTDASPSTAAYGSSVSPAAISPSSGAAGLPQNAVPDRPVTSTAAIAGLTQPVGQPPPPVGNGAVLTQGAAPPPPANPTPRTTTPTTARTTTKPPVTKNPTTRPPTPGIRIRSHETGTCLDGRNSELQLWACDSRDSQNFTFPSDGTMRTLGKCVRVKGTGNGSRLGLGACTGSSAQGFDLNSSNDLVSTQVYRCVDVTDNRGGNAVPAQLWDCAGTDNQKWN